MIPTEGCHLVTHYHNNLLDFEHLSYLHQLSDAFDSFICVTSHSNPLIHPTIQTHWPRAQAIEDPQCTWVSSLRKTFHLDPTPEQLAISLRCQAVYSNGECVQFWHQPLSDHWTRFFQYHTNQQLIQQFGPEGMEWLRDRNKRTVASTFEPTVGISMDRRDPGWRSYMLYYMLQPNKELEQWIKHNLS